MQKSGAGLHTANSCYWDTTTDGENWMFLLFENLQRNICVQAIELRNLCVMQTAVSFVFVFYSPGRKLHSEVGESHHVLRRQRVCCRRGALSAIAELWPTLSKHYHS